MGMVRATLAISLVALTGSAPAFGQTHVPSGTLGDETWTERGSPYLVTGEVTLDSLTLSAGAQVLIATVDPTLTIKTSSLTVNGEPERPVTFEAETPADNYSWYGLIASQATVTHLVMRHANSALTTRGTVTNSVFEDNVWGLELRGDTVVDRCRFANRTLGVFFGSDNQGHVRITNSLFVGHDLDGIACKGRACLVSSCTFDNNRFAIYATGQATVRNSIFSNNIYGIQNNSASVQVSHSNFWQNIYDFDGKLVEVEGNTKVDPEYVSASDFHLSSTSRCIDAGGMLDAPDHDLDGTLRPIEGDGEPDADGSSYDMGAYEFDPDRADGAGGESVDGNGGQAGESSEGVGGQAPSVGGVGGSVSSDGAAQSNSENSATTAISMSSAGGVTGASIASQASVASQASSGGAMGASTNSSEMVGDAPPRLSKGCGCKLHDSPPSGGWLGLMLLGAAWVRRWPLRLLESRSRAKRSNDAEELRCAGQLESEVI
jgi:MYXO-CTERM domain-containing protein